MNHRNTFIRSTTSYGLLNYSVIDNNRQTYKSTEYVP